MKLSTGLSVAFITLTSFKSGNNIVKDYFTVPGPIAFNHTSYLLSWSSHPSPNYIKQEYLPAGEAAATFTEMVMIEAVTGNVSLPGVVKEKIAELEERKKTDPLTSYQVIRNPKTGEYMLDFIMSQSAGGKTAVAEWNVYRYQQLSNAGKKGIVLFACSKRGYGDAVQAFLARLKIERQKNISTLAGYQMPLLHIKND